MKVVVLGAGLIGTTSAYYLARLGHQVVVIDRQPDVGLETSFANGGLVTPSMSDPWAAPGAPLKMVKWFGREDAPLLVRPSAVPGMAAWGLRFLRNCTAQRWRRNTCTILRLAEYSRDLLDELSAETGIAYDRQEVGTLRLFRDDLSMEAARRGAELLGEFDVPHRLLDAEECARLEPALRPVIHELTGGIHFPNDRSGDALKFTQEVARLCKSMGVEFRFGTTVTGLETDGGEIAGVALQDGRVQADRYLLALGSYSTPLARRVRIKLPVHPVKGYSVTVSAQGWNDAPTVPLIDDGRKIAVTRLGERLRVAGTAEFAGYDNTENRRRSELLLRAMSDLLPDFTVPETAEHWAGLRPMTPDGAPILGPSPYRNLYLSCGQGHLGWTLVCGSGKVVADLISDRPPEVDLAGMTLARYQPLAA